MKRTFVHRSLIAAAAIAVFSPAAKAQDRCEVTAKAQISRLQAPWGGTVDHLSRSLNGVRIFYGNQIWDLGQEGSNNRYKKSLYVSVLDQNQKAIAMYAQKLDGAWVNGKGKTIAGSAITRAATVIACACGFQPSAPPEKIKVAGHLQQTLR